MNIKRNAYQKLSQWKSSKDRKPLLIRGARQVGKTTLVRTFSREFFNYIELNLEKKSDKKLFEIEDVRTLFNAVCLYKKVNRIDKPTLLFIDEIQESPTAIKMLRYFYEELPDIFVIAAGSLLEFAFNKVSNFPVGRIDYLFMSPLNFQEYLGAMENLQAVETINTIPVPEHAHSILLNLFHQYAIIGGMPQIVSRYLQSNNMINLSAGYNKLWQSFKDDVKKYGKNETERKIIRHVIESAPSQNDRIKFEGFGNSNYRSREVGEALRALDLSKIIQLIYPGTILKPPIVTDFNKRPRLQFLDTGLLNHALQVQVELFTLADMDDFYRGKIIQHLVTQELISVHDQIAYKPHFWVRQEKDSNSEVDLIYHYQKYLFPIEIKSGSTGALRSLHQFVERTNHPYALRVYSGPFRIEKSKTAKGIPYILMNLPYYLGTKIPDYIKFLIEKYKL